MLLLEPELLHRIASAVRAALPANILLSAKIRTGFAAAEEIFAIVPELASAGIDELIIHGRTRRDLYRPGTVNWEIMGQISAQYPDLRIVANGDICSYADADLCVKQARTRSLMIGRAALMVPNMGHVLRSDAEPYNAVQILSTAREFAELLIALKFEDKSVLDRTKQFLALSRRADPDLAAFFASFCQLQNVSEGMALLERGLPSGGVNQA